MKKTFQKLVLTMCLIVMMFALVAMPVAYATSVRWVSPCDTLYEEHFKDAYGSSCGDPDYDPVADFDKNGKVELLDFVEVADMHDISDECKKALEDDLSPCGPCGKLFYLIRGSHNSDCGDDEYNPVADINKDGKVDLGDQGILAGIYDDEEECDKRLKDTTDPCESSPPATSCKDSDGGRKYYARGHVEAYYGSNSVILPDRCRGDVVVENYCSNNEPQTILHKCEYGCEYGACLRAAPTCTDSDGGKDYDKKGTVTFTLGSGQKSDLTDVCTSDGLLEYYCSGNEVKSISHSCDAGYECQDGACVEEEPETTCTDSDGNFDDHKKRLSTKGTCRDKEGEHTDVCEDSKSLRDYYCEPTSHPDHCGFVTYNCEAYGFTGCKDGACVEEEPETTCTDSDGGLVYDDKGIVKVYSSDSDEPLRFTDFCKRESSLYSDNYDNYVVEYYCSKGSVEAILHSCGVGYDCKEGTCVELEDDDSVKKVYEGCEDSDGGIAYDERGRLSVDFVDQPTTYARDSCDSIHSLAGYNTEYVRKGNYLVELYCSNDIPEAIFHSCAEGYHCKNGACVKEDVSPCEKEGYECTSRIRGCGHYKQIGLDCEISGLVCCEEVPYCGDGICFDHSIKGYGETEENCPEDCKGETSCVSEGEELRPTPSQNQCCPGLKECHYLDEEHNDELEVVGGPYGLCLESCEYGISGTTLNGGYDIYSQGIIVLDYLQDYTDREYHYEDTCSEDGKTLIEYYIEKDHQGNVFPKLDRVECEYGCLDGRCLKDVTCTDSDGMDRGKKGKVKFSSSNGIAKTYEDECISENEVREYFCIGENMKWTDGPCGMGTVCKDGACVKEEGQKPSPACSDSDGGVNYEEQGVITHIDSGGNTRTYSDYCFLGRILKEYYCYDNMVRHTYHFCELGVSCNSGACQDDKRISVSYSEQSDKQETIITGQAVEDIDNDRGIFERITDAFIVLLG